MELLEHLNLYFGYEANSINEFIKDFKEENEEDDEHAVKSLLMFLSSFGKN